MDRIRRTLPLRRVAWMAALAALTLPAGQAQAAKKAKAPVITSVSPMKAAVGETLTIKGRNFRKGKGRNSVGFKRDGSAVIFVKSDISTARMLKVKVPSRLEEQMTNQGTTKLAARFRLRILTSRFGPSFTSVKHSPLIGPHVPKGTAGTPGSGSGSGAGGSSASTPPAAEADCDNDGQVNSVDLDDDNDLLPDALENVLGTNGCKADSDDDTVEDGYEYRSAIDLNDDEYQSPNVVLPYPGQRPYPNALDKNDAGVDYDGDGLTVAEEYGLWKVSTPVAQRTFADVAGKASPLSYSAGLTYSVSSYCKDVPGNPLCGVGDDNRRVPTLAAGTYDKWLAFTGWAAGHGYDPVRLHDSGEWYGHSTGRNDYRLLDMNRAGGVSGPESMNLDQPGRGVGWLADGERDAGQQARHGHRAVDGEVAAAPQVGQQRERRPDDERAAVAGRRLGEEGELPRREVAQRELGLRLVVRPEVALELGPPHERRRGRQQEGDRERGPEAVAGYCSAHQSGPENGAGSVPNSKYSAQVRESGSGSQGLNGLTWP